MAACSGGDWIMRSADAAMSSTWTSTLIRTGCASSGSVQPNAWPSITMNFGSGPHRGHTALSDGMTNVLSMALLSFTTSCRRNAKDNMSDERYRVSSVYVVRAVMINEYNLSSSARVKTANLPFLSRLLMLKMS